MKKTKHLISAFLCCVFGMFTVALAEPGTSDDPLISKSYIENQLMPEIRRYVESRLAELSGGGNGTSGASFEVVEVKQGSEVICSAGTELILRMGKAGVIATEKGGVADTTGGYDLANGEAMPSNHLLIVPVSDGRGVRADTDIILMIKGGYSIR